MTAPAPAWAIELLAHARVGRLATVDAAGQPLVVPVCYVYDGERCYSAVDGKPKRTRNLKRLRNLADNPRVSLAIDHYDEDWRALRYVIVQGRGDVLESGAEFSRAIDGLVAKYPQYHELRLERPTGAVVRITPERILSWRFA
ncbi:MAG TPA: TIGR03668 family PPOX class F420-dependent oxidoreductase [Candidatus Limnocylindria bacterium]|nr:TIGR03668 family PPOX class F420-dependent oxidoreductase [Candidatus Limnocylindria bacterium]